MKFSALVFLILSAVLTPFAMAQSAPPTSGLVITQVNSQQWQIRLISRTAVQRFSAVMESDMPITAVQGVTLERGDTATLLTPASLGATFSTTRIDTDGVNFTVSAGAKLCLRDTGSSGVSMYLGVGLQNAVPVTAPVALAGADACGGSTGGPPPLASRKFHPGHWIVMNDTDSQAVMATAIQPGVVGIMKRYTWLSLEPAPGVYQFAQIQSDLDWAAANGLRLIVMIEYKSFSKSVKFGPADLDAYEAPNNSNGYTMALWSPVVVARYNALVQALGVQVDSNENFEGLATQESAPSLSASALNAFGYTPQIDRDALISILNSAAASLPTSRVFWFMNFLQGNQSYIGTIANAVAANGVSMGGPDVWPDNQALESTAYPFYTQFYGKMPLFGQVAAANYAEPHMTLGYTTKYWTTAELFNFARINMHANYLFWARLSKPNPSDAYALADALPVIAANASFSP